MNDEYEPVITFDTGNERYDATRENGHLFTFLGKKMINDVEVDLSTRDCIYIDEPEENVFIFNKDTVQAAGKLMLQYRFPANLNQRDVPKAIEKAYQTYQQQKFEAMQEGFGTPDYFDADDWGD